MTTDQSTLTEDYSQNYHRQWVLFFLLMAAIGLYFWYHTYVQRTHPAPNAAAGEMTNFYYVLRMPEMQVMRDTRSAQQQMFKWLTSLQKAGFHVMRWSDILLQINRGTAVPDKAVVLVFDPGYRKTADTYLPVLNKLQLPAVWLTNGKGIELNDKRFVSRHLLKVMRNSGLWDVAYYAPRRPVTLDSREGQPLIVGSRSPWHPDAGRFALNRGYPANAFDRLNVNTKWTEEDLVNRLLVEQPVIGPTALSIQQIQGRNWGIGVDVRSQKDARFTLRSPNDRRSGSLYWLGTLNVNDLHLRMDVKSLVGEMRILLRSDLQTGENISILFGRGTVSVDAADRNGRVRHLAGSLCPDLKPRTPFTAVLAVMGRRLVLAVNDHPLIALENLPETTTNKAMLRLVVQDSIKGVGEARSVRMIFTPLRKDVLR